MRMLVTLCLATQGVFLGCSSDHAASSVATSTIPDKQLQVPQDDVLFKSTYVWEHGRIPPVRPEPVDLETGEIIESVQLVSETLEPIVFSGIDKQTESFLNWPWLKPVEKFGCTAPITVYEDALEVKLTQGTPELKLQALSILMRLKAPSSVALQWKAIQELAALPDRPSWQPLIAKWQGCFEPQRLEEMIAHAPPQDRCSAEPPEFFWSIRAIGVIRYVKAIDRLAELSTAGHLYTSLAAEKSLEDFEGLQADQALANCLLGWQYDAYIRAGNALLERNKPLLLKSLLSADAPEGCRYRQGIFLAGCDHPAAIEILCQELHRYVMVGEGFHEIARLAGPEHTKLIEELPSRVREDQVERAKKTLRQYQARMQGQ